MVAEQLWSEFEPAAKELGLKAEKKTHTVVQSLRVEKLEKKQKVNLFQWRQRLGPSADGETCLVSGKLNNKMKRVTFLVSRTC